MSTKIVFKVANERGIYCKSIDAPDLPDGAKNVIFSDGEDIYIIFGDDQYGLNFVMPDIVDVSVIENNGEKKVVSVTFSDQDVVKAILNQNDTFDLEQGISVCVTKKLLNRLTCGNGSSAYNKIIRHGLKVYEKKMKQMEADRLAIEEAEARRKKYIEKRKKKMERKHLAEREEKIAIQAEAYLRAMKKYNAISGCEDDHR